MGGPLRAPTLIGSDAIHPGSKSTSRDPESCHCGLKQIYSRCCGRFIAGDEHPATAEALMRSRYSAFVAGERDYLLATWHPDTRPSQVTLGAAQRWLGLRIKATEGGGPEDTAGVVEFVARYKIAGKGYRLHERSNFQRVDGRWCYRDGEHL